MSTTSQHTDPARLSGLRVAIVHYWFVTWRGGEKVVASLLKLFPNADLYTLFYDPNACGDYLAGHHITTSTLDKVGLRRHYQKLYPLYPYGVRSLKLRHQYDLIISSESGPAKGISKPWGVPHLCYVHTPMRYCWGFTQQYLDAIPRPVRPLARSAFEKLRRWDLSTVDNVDRYVANSYNVRDRVRRFYQRDAGVVPPPISLDLFSAESLIRRPLSNGEYFLSFGAITPYKNIRLLIDTFNANGRRLVVIGDGSEKTKLERKARENIRFLGSLPWDQVRRYLRGAKALVFPGEEDFGMVPLEAMAHGLPVIALGRGGALETVVENPAEPSESSGIFFSEPTGDDLNHAIERFEERQDDFNPAWIQAHARQFGEDIFLARIESEIHQLLRCSRL